MLLEINGCSKSFGSREIFCSLSFEIKNNEKIAVVGRNGVGKTTLLNIIAGTEGFDAGRIYRDKTAAIGFLEQIVFADESVTARAEFESCFGQINRCKARMRKLELTMESDCRTEILDKYARVCQQYEDLGGYQYQTELLTVFTKFGFRTEEIDKRIQEFSGGEKTRLAFVRLLLSKPDILILDEPTNHLDMNTIEWLEEYLRRYPKAVLIVSHDRMFLDHTVTIVYEIEFGKACRYAGNYTSFMAKKQEDMAKQNHDCESQKKEIRRLEEVIEKFRYKATKAKFAQSKIKYLERMERLSERREDTSAFRAHFSARTRGAAKVLSIRDLCIGYEEALCQISLDITRGSRVAVIGRNGTGKSTLVKTLVGQVAPRSGSYTYGVGVETGYFDQELTQFEDGLTVLEELWNTFPDLGQTEIRTTLGSFLFTGDDVFKATAVLSGGEKVRLALAKLMLRHDNFLILDEPTNHLDIYGRQALERALADYDGTVLFVSHDRYFIAAAATAVLELGDSGAVYYPLTYAEYLAKKGQLRPEIHRKVF